jgi:hypothetical protein
MKPECRADGAQLPEPISFSDTATGKRTRGAARDRQTCPFRPCRVRRKRRE